MDMTHVSCGIDGWAHLAVVIDWHDREIVGYELARRGRARARGSLPGALRHAPAPRGHARRPLRQRADLPEPRFRAACGDYRLRQEFIAPYTPEQNGIVERFFRSAKEEWVWLHTFASFGEARRALRRWIAWYNKARPHEALRYLSPRQYRTQQLQRVA